MENIRDSSSIIMDVFQSLILGMVQGLTEFLPISSSGHLIVIPWLFKWPEHSLSFDVILHIGTLLALVSYFWKYWLKLIKEGLLSLKETTLKGAPERRIFWLIVLSSIPGAIIGKIFATKAETALRNPLLIALTMGGFAILFFFIDRLSQKNKTLNEITIFDALVIGVFQAFAIVPGVSRSGITIVSGLALRLKRETATKFSFLLSVPIILGANLLKIKDVSRMFNSGEGIFLLLGLISSTAAGILAIRYLLAYIKKHNFNLFIIYRILFCLTILSIFFLRR